ncbi:cytochrome P450 [Amycolatopsis mediterranei S699]|uniref:Cytochrome P450 n=1 Tax=Amycolatopsis mediterranei (strain S699) TaxID=713604 RepID=A0A9R0U883_AMYMS|nr:cytochrome P450 [Amycolatopsis mediterranei S699]
MSRAAEALRERVPTLTALPLPPKVDERWLRSRWPVEELATPPAGSGLKPVLGDAGPPVVGHMLEMMRFGPAFGLRRYELYGPVSWTGGFGRRIVALSGPEATQIALVNKDKAFSQEGWKFFIEKFFERGLMLMDFGEHHLHRRIMQEAFTRPRLAGYVGEMGPALREGVASWGSSERPRLYWALKQLTLDVATRVFMGMRSGDDAARINRAFVSSGAGRHRLRALPGAGRPLVGRAARPEGPRALLRRNPARQTPFGRRRPVRRALPGHHQGRRPVLRHRRRQPHDLPDDGRARHDDHHQQRHGLLPRQAPGVAGTRPRGVPGPGRRPARHRGAGAAGDPRPRDEGGAAAGRTGAVADPPDRQGHRGARPLHPGGHPGRRLAHGQPLHAGVLDEPLRIRPGALRRTAARGQVAPDGVDAVRRRRAQVHRAPLRQSRGEVADARTAAGVPLVGSGELHRALGLRLPAGARGRSAGPPGPPLTPRPSTTAYTR